MGQHFMIVTGENQVLVNMSMSFPVSIVYIFQFLFLKKSFQGWRDILKG